MRITFAIIVILSLLLYGGLHYYNDFRTTNQVYNQKIGVIAPMSGDSESFGVGIRKGLELAKKELGKNDIQLVFQDTECRKEKIDDAIESLRSQGVVAIIGEVCSGATLAAAPLVNEYRIPLISPGSTHIDLTTNGGEYLFRTIPSDKLQGEFAAVTLILRQHNKAALIYSDETYGTGYRDIFTPKYTELGGEVVFSKAIERESIDLNNQLKGLVGLDTDVVFIVSNSVTTSEAIIRALNDLGIDTPIFGAESLKDNTLVSNLGNLAENMTVIAVSSGNERFRQQFLIEYKEDPATYSAQAYDAFSAIVKALEKGARSGEEIKNELNKLSFSGVTGYIDFDKNGDIQGEYDISVVHNGKFIVDNR